MRRVPAQSLADINKVKLFSFAFMAQPAQWWGRFLGIIIGWDPSVCKSNQLHVDILQFSFIKLGYIL